MKINGNNSGAHAAKKPSRERTAPKKQKTARRRMGRAARMATVIVCCVLALACGGENIYDGWMKNKKSAMISCNDGFRPVSFYIEALDEDAD